jgi:hypothetical protein
MQAATSSRCFFIGCFVKTAKSSNTPTQVKGCIITKSSFDNIKYTFMGKYGTIYCFLYYLYQLSCKYVNKIKAALIRQLLLTCVLLLKLLHFPCRTVSVRPMVRLPICWEHYQHNQYLLYPFRCSRNRMLLNHACG